MNTNKETFGSFLKQLRIKNSFSLRAFASIIEIAPSYLSDIEQGKRNAPAKERLERMIKALNLTEKETEKFYDLARQGKKVEIAEDVQKIILEDDTIPVLCRKIKQKNYDVKKLIKRIDSDK
ncbi:MAG: helix-turn-helix domain-containing protein [Bacteroidetes bacterium]|nr:helix-turn-helix domain-containing protein [Bacteroidota bacterium]